MSSSIRSNRRSYAEFRTGWRTLTAVTIAASFGFPTLAFFSIGIFAPILADQYEWSFSSIMGGVMLASLVIFFFGPAFGRWIDRRGPRRIAALSLVGFGLSYMSLGASSGSIVQYYVSWAFMSVTGIGATAIAFTHMVNEVFRERRGLALGIALSSSGISAVLVKQLAGVTIELLGWRETIVLIGSLPILIGAPILIWGVAKDRTSSTRKSRLIAQPDKRPRGVDLSQALRERFIWILIIAFAAIAFGNGAPIPNLENLLRTQQFDQQQIVQLTSAIGISLIVGRVVGGWLIDYFWAPIVGFVLLMSAATGCWILSWQDPSLTQALLAITCISLAAGVEYDLLAFLVARYLGRRNYGVLYSIIFGVFAINAGLGPIVLGWLFDRHGDYGIGMIVCAAMLLFAGVALLGLGPYPRLTATTPE